MNLRSRIYLALLPLLLLFLGLTSYLLISAQQYQIESNEIAASNISLSRGFQETGSTLYALSTILDVEHDEIPEWLPAKLRQLTTTLDENIDKHSTSFANERLTQLFNETVRYEANLRNISLQSERYLNQETNADGLRKAIQISINDTETIRGKWELYLKETQARFNKERRTVLDIVIGCMALAIVLTLGISSLLWNRIIKPVEQITEGLEQFSENSTPMDVDYQGKDELGKLSLAFSRMTYRLNEFQSINNAKVIRSTAALKTVLELSPDAFFILNSDWQPTYASPKANELLANSALEDGFPAEMVKIFEQSYHTHEAQLSKDFTEAIRLNVEDKEQWFLLQAFPINVPVADISENLETDEPLSLAVILQDVTLLKLSNSLRKNLVATVSHELKTPITSARMSLYLLLEQSLGPLNEDQKELLETARDDLNRQLATIEHLLDLSRLDAQEGALKLSHFDIAEIIHEAIATHDDIATSYDVTVSFEPIKSPISLEADRQSLGIVLNNFIVNAIKYSGQGKQVTVSAEATATHVRVNVSDNGPGMDNATLSTIFEAYHRGDSNSIHDVKGTGIGLNISKDIIEKHGGQIGCDSKLGEGSCFFFEVPLSH